MESDYNKKNIILDLTLEFSVAIIEFCEILDENKKYVISRQLLRSGTSIGANIREAQNAESKKDFIHKVKIAAKEAEETKYWLLLCTLSKNYPNPIELTKKIDPILKIINKIISTTKIQLNQPIN